MRELDRLNTLFEFALYALVLLPFAMIALGGSINLFLGVIFALSIPASIFVHRRGLASERLAILWNIIVLAFLVGTGAQLLLTELSLLAGGIRFVVVLTIIKLFSRMSERDEMQLFALSFLGVAAATTVNEDVTFGLLFGVYVLLGTFALAVFHLRSELAARPRLALAEHEPSLNRGYFAVLMGMGVLILGASLSIFFAFPRIGLGFFSPQMRDGVSLAGFNDNVELGGHGTIRDNPEVVMRVEYLDGEPGITSNIHWRVITFDHYDGRRWSRGLESGSRAIRIDGDESDLSYIYNSSGAGQRLQIYLEPLGKDLLPVVRPTHSLRLGATDYVLKWGPGAGHVRRDAYDDIHHTIESEVGTAYILTRGEGIEPPTRNPEPPSEFLQLPDLTPRVQELAAQMTRDATTHAAKAEAIKRALGNYAYTTDLPAVGADPIDSFLFETKRGHCEYFATATVMLLRQNGVPARLVNGFLGGKWNDVGGYLAVRQGDAHSWAEYWDPQLGWTEIDATPASDMPDVNSALETARATLDSMRLRWMKWVIEYDLNAQIDVFRKVAGLLQPSGAPEAEQSKIATTTERTGQWREALLIAGLATLLFAAFLRTRRRRRRRDGAPWTTFTAMSFVGFGVGWAGWFQGYDIVPMLTGAGFPLFGVLAALYDHRRANPPSVWQLFEVIEQSGRRHDIPRRADEGPAEYLNRLADANPAVAQDIVRFKKHYLRARFSGPADHEEMLRLNAAAHRIAGRLRKS